ncbi:hypothetical protein BJY00DRAFT_324240 [Aspergillus carlsbadensis]|nr:hypothetical protein BJY00DRAFT_324240 [Aspergillus carlsbadensis]
MYSYHRILSLFGRSINDWNLECDCDVHPWEIDIDGSQWGGRIRLVGFVDVFFIISYSSNARFERGIIIYKDREDLEKLLPPLPPKDENEKPAGPVKDGSRSSAAQAEPSEPSTSSQASEVLPNRDQYEKHLSKAFSDGKKEESTASSPNETKEEPLRRHLFRKSARYIVRGWGHEIRLASVYPWTCFRRYEIEMCIPRQPPLARSIKRGLKEHNLVHSAIDISRYGLVSAAGEIGSLVSNQFGGGMIDDTMKKTFAGLTTAKRSGEIALSNEVPV